MRNIVCVFELSNQFLDWKMDSFWNSSTDISIFLLRFSYFIRQKGQGNGEYALFTKKWSGNWMTLESIVVATFDFTGKSSYCPESQAHDFEFPIDFEVLKIGRIKVWSVRCYVSRSVTYSDVNVTAYHFRDNQKRDSNEILKNFANKN